MQQLKTLMTLIQTGYRDIDSTGMTRCKQMRLVYRKVAFSLALLVIAAVACAIPGYRINGEQSAQKAVSQYAGDCFKFGAVVYQAELDKNVWQLTIVAHRYLQQKPNDPQRKCSFTMAYWRSQSVTETVPLADRKQLDGLFEEARRDTKEAAEELPNSATAHMNYGQFLLNFVPGMGKVQPMLYEFKTAVALRPDLGRAHYWLAEGYMGSGDESAKAVDTILWHANKAVDLDPRLANSYYIIASVYDWPSHRNLKRSKEYLDKYVAARPEQATRKDVVAFQKYLKENLPN